MNDKESDHQGPLHERLKTIVGVEKQIDDLLRVSKDCLQELAKEKQISKAKMEESATSFRRLLSQIETELASQLQYLGNVCVGSSHQGSTFGAHQNAQLAQSGVSSLHQNLYEILGRLKIAEEEEEEEETAGNADEPIILEDEEEEEGEEVDEGEEGAEKVEGEEGPENETEETSPDKDSAEKEGNGSERNDEAMVEGEESMSGIGEEGSSPTGKYEHTATSMAHDESHDNTSTGVNREEGTSSINEGMASYSPSDPPGSDQYYQNE